VRQVAIAGALFAKERQDCTTSFARTRPGCLARAPTRPARPASDGRPGELPCSVVRKALTPDQSDKLLGVLVDDGVQSAVGQLSTTVFLFRELARNRASDPRAQVVEQVDQVVDAAYGPSDRDRGCVCAGDQAAPRHGELHDPFDGHERQDRLLFADG
jgi:hypothetical protein